MKLLASNAACAVALVLAACGASPRGDPSVARVGTASIAAAALSQQIAALAPEHLAPDPPHFEKCVAARRALVPESIALAPLKEECREQYQSLKRQALQQLIASQWVLGEAALRGLPTSGATRAGRARSAEAKLRALVARGEQPVTPAEIDAYYRRHIAAFERPEVREIYFVEHIPSLAKARELRREVSSGKRNVRKIGIHELVVEREPFESVPGKLGLARAIFSAKPHTLSAMLMFDRQPAFFDLVRIVPPSVRPLAHLRHSIERSVARERRLSRLAGFIGEWRRRWIAKTDCSPGYVVQKCRQYTGAMSPEDPYSLS